MDTRIAEPLTISTRENVAARRRNAHAWGRKRLWAMQSSCVMQAIAIVSVLIAIACSGEDDSSAEANPSGAGAGTVGEGSAGTLAAPDPVGQPGAAAAGKASGTAGRAGEATSPAAAGSSSPSAGGRGGDTAAMAGADAPAPAALGPDCVDDPLAGEQPFGSGFYQQFRGLYGCTPTADVALYRQMLPEKFEMPADPQVCFYVNDFMISSVGPYHEVAILLPTTYKGESAKYTLTMDLDSVAAMTGGRSLGFPKYMGQVSLVQTGNDWVGTASANGAVDLKASYTGECNRSDEFLWPDFFNLTPIPAGTSTTEAFLPPRSGSVLRVPADYRTPPKYYSLKGSVRLEIRDDLPWNGLIDETKSFPGLMSWFVGGVGLGNQPLD